MVIIFGTRKAILGGGADAAVERTAAASTPAALSSDAEPAAQVKAESGEAEPAAAATSDDSITLIASGNVYVLVKQRNDQQELLRKTMSAGETIQLAKSGPVDILFTAGEHLIVDHQGERLQPSSAGTAKISIP